MVEEHIFVSNIAILDETVPVIYIFTSYLNKDTRIQRIHESNRSRALSKTKYSQKIHSLVIDVAFLFPLALASPPFLTKLSSQEA